MAPAPFHRKLRDSRIGDDPPVSGDGQTARTACRALLLSAAKAVLAGTRPAGMILSMTVVKINAITVPPDSGDELARRFAARAGAVDNQDGFEGFELLQPTDGRTTWLVVTRWRDEESFEAWRTSPAFGHGHRQGAGHGEGRGHGGASGRVANRRSRWRSAASSGRSRSPAAHQAGSRGSASCSPGGWLAARRGEEDRDRARGLLLILRVRGICRNRPFPPLRALVAVQLTDLDVEWLGPVLDPDAVFGSALRL